MRIPSIRLRNTTMPRLYRGNSFNPPRPIGQAMRRGWTGCCPQCGAVGLQCHCEACGHDASPARVGNAVPLLAIPAAFSATMLAIVALDLGWEFLFEHELPLVASMIVALALASALVFELVPRLRGMLEGLQWALWMHAFDPHERRAPSPVGKRQQSAIPSENESSVAAASMALESSAGKS